MSHYLFTKPPLGRTINRQNPISARMAIAFAFNEGGGAVLNTQGSFAAKSATVTGSSGQPSWKPNALSFVNNGYINIPVGGSSSIPLRTFPYAQHALAFGANLATSQPGGFSGFCGFGDASGNAWFYQCFNGSGLTMGFYTGANFVSLFTIPSGYHHYFFTYDGNATVRAYIDGTLKITQSVNPIGSSYASRFLIGVERTLAQKMTGDMSYLYLMYSGTATDAESIASDPYQIWTPPTLRRGYTLGRNQSLFRSRILQSQILQGAA